MPLHHAGVWRVRWCSLQTKSRTQPITPNADHDSADAHDAADQRTPYDRLAPQRTVPAERREIEPVQYGAEISADTRACVRSHDWFGSLCGEVIMCACIVTKRDSMQRH